MFAQNSLFDLPSLDSVIDRTPLTATPNTLVTCAIALMIQAKENSCELRDTNRHQTLNLLNRERNSCILVVEAGKLVGIFTQRDAVKLAASQRNLNGIAIEGVMTRKLITLKRSPNQTILTALSLLHRYRLNHLPILDEQEQLQGLITQTDLLQAIDPVELWNVVNMLQQQVGEKMTALERSNQELQQEISRRKQAEAESKQINDSLEMRVRERTAELTRVNARLQLEIEERRQSELKLSKSQQDLADFIENAVVPMHWVTSDGTISWANQAELDMLGYTKEEYIGRSIVEFHVDRKVIDEILTRLARNETLRNFQARLRCKDGSTRHVLIDSNVSWRNEEFFHTRCFTRDVTESLQAEELQRQSEAQLQAILDRTQAVIYLKDKQGRYILINRRYEKLFGIDREWVKGKTDYDIFPKEIAEVFQANDRLVFEAQKPLESEEVAPQEDGLHTYISIKFPLFDSSGSVYGMCGISTDITERKQAEQKLQETLRSLEFQKYALDRSAIVAITDRQGIITYVNEQFCQISKYKKEELIGQTHRIINSGYHSPEFFQELWRTIVSGKVWQGEIKNKAKDGSFYWVETTIVPLRDETGKPFQYLAIRFDISERKQAEESLRQSEQKFRAIFDGTFGFIGLLTTEGILIEANRTALEAIGAKPTDVMGQPFWQAPWWLHSPQLQKQLQQAIVTAANGELVRFEAEHILANGTSIFVDFSLKPIFDDTGKVVMLIPEGRDITDRKQAEENLRESKRRLSTLIDNLPGYVYRVANDPNYTPEFISEGVFEITGYRQDEYLIERTISCGQDIHPDDRDNVWNIVQQAVAAKQPYECEYRIITKSGNQKWVWERGQGIYGDNDELLNLEGFVTDTSDRKQAELKIREQSALLDVTTDAILVRDLESRIQYWNKGAEKIYGWQASETIGQDVRSLLYKEVSPQIEIAYSTVIEKGEWQGELRKVAKTDKEVIVESRWTLVRDEADHPKFILSVDTDITERKLLEAQFLRAQRLESLGTLASGIAHDMNNILTPILAAAQLLPLKLKNPDRHTQQLLQLSQESAKRGVDLVKQILSFARGAEGERTQIQIAHILKEVVKVAKQTFPKSIEICLNLTTNNLWLVSGDATQLHQVLMNLFINARDAMPEEGILTVTAENLRVDESYARMNLGAKVGLYVVITVADTGIGISEETRKRIFEPFFTTKEPGKGTGLGLSTVIGIIKSHQGFVKVYSEVGKGTSFKLYLPADENVETRQSVEDLELFKGHGELILVVDDEASVREITKATLENYNYRVITANDGIEAIALYAQHQNEIAAVLLDLMMPSLDTATIVRTLERINPEIKIIAMSGLSANGKVVNANYACVQAFLAKPFTSQKILQILHDTVINNRS